MKKIIKFFSIFLFLFLAANIASAETIKILGETTGNFTTKHPTKTFGVRVINDYNLANGGVLPNGTILNGSIVQVNSAKRARRDAYFYLKLTSYTKPDGKVCEINNENAIVKVVAYDPIDWKETTLSTGTTVAGLFVKNIAYPVNFLRGVVQPYEDKSRLSSGIQKTYEGSLLTYISKGEELSVKTGDKVVLIFRFEENSEAE